MYSKTQQCVVSHTTCGGFPKYGLLLGAYNEFFMENNLYRKEDMVSLNYFVSEIFIVIDSLFHDLILNNVSV